MKCLADGKTVREIVKQQVDERADAIIHNYTLALAYAILSNCGLSRNMAQKILTCTQKVAEAINEDYTNFQAIEKTLKDEYDFRIDFKE